MSSRSARSCSTRSPRSSSGSWTGSAPRSWPRRPAPRQTRTAVPPRDLRASSLHSAPMEKRILGRTGRAVSVVGLGTWQLGADWGDVTEKDALAVLEAAVGAGVTLLDTADV